MTNETQDNPALRAYTRTRGELMGILKSLRGAEIQNDVNLPHVVVVGTQSVGKSSLIEAISGLKLPRESGTCTRCPMECRLENSPYVSVNITLRFTKNSTGTGDLQEVREIPFKSELTDLDEVKEALRDAQKTILEPSRLGIPELGSPGDAPLSFSENCVCVHAKGPKMPDLYFYDLPGIIANVPDGHDQRHIDLIQDLVRKYVAKPNCIVLLVIACNYDLENQGAAPLVLSDPNLRQRTVGVLTKADRIESGMEATWIRMFNNETTVLKNGWFAVKLPAQTDLELTWERAREQEKTFFSSSEPWKALSADSQHRLGSQLVAEHLSRLLSNLVASELPNIHSDIAKSLRDCSVELAKLPERTFEDSHKEILSLIRDFMYKISKHVTGVPPKLHAEKPGLIYAVNEIFGQLKVEIYGTVPQFFPWTKGYADSNGDMQELRGSLGDLIGGQGTVMYLDEVKSLAHESKTRELPGHTPYAVNVILTEDFMKGWEIKAKSCFEQVRDVFAGHLDDMLRTHFEEYAHGGLLDEVSAIVSKQISRCALSTMQRVKELCRMELQPFTLLSEEYVGAQEMFYSKYSYLYGRTLALAQNPQSGPNEMTDDIIAFFQSNPIGQHLMGAVIGPTLRTFVEGLANPATRPPDQVTPLNDEWHKSLMIMASVRSYFQIASKRFVDIVPKLIDEVFLRACDSSIGIAVMQMNLSPERCLKFLEDPSVPEKRYEIVEKKKRLEIAKQKLDKVFLSSADIVPGGSVDRIAGGPSPDSWSTSFIPFSLPSSILTSPSEADISESV